MATFRIAIQIEDRLSQPIRAMHTASGTMFDTSSIVLMRRELANAATSESD
ncbi:hypothetical protein J2D69_12615 [Lysinibacillus sphaericus]|uniref:Uncharacterized protein n=2 Tax=Lysinibacillus TaxID=400634 RepID=W7SAE0_LYSSH|nr:MULTISPECIES: hypothetical protein [Lysinibacillus]MBE5083549.1 hypothetical protein [Bacillus thuringiensis]UZM97842.1 hypothetical protein OL548_23170 [Lysinibacillus sp. MHQ-1]EWH33423.1 hypothetical protein P799_10575 [Lysinibacillus sphaericus CBAM5]MCS1396054.1 hypothetical protein [Lysinibacillus sp. PB211]MDR0159209.1 hypothetical protein [Lysinibacillus sphaericus]